MSMPHLPFIVAAYAVTFAGLGGLVVWSLVRLRRAEQGLDGPAERSLDGDR